LQETGVVHQLFRLAWTGTYCHHSIASIIPIGYPLVI
jgi:hypothetical protein